jgi:transposase-like protein
MPSGTGRCLHDEQAAYAIVEEALWADGQRCAHCGRGERVTRVRPNPEKRIRVGLWRCGGCKRQFSVKTGTIFEDSNLRLQLWLQAVVLVAAPGGISAYRLHQILGVTYKTAWQMERRIREAMAVGHGREGRA